MEEKPVSESEIEQLLGKEGGFFWPPHKARSRSWFVLGLGGALVISICLNIIQANFYRIMSIEISDCASERFSNFAGLKNKEIQSEFRPSGYSSTNDTYRDSLWESFGEGSGIVAVPNQWAAEKGLPPGLKVPWNESQSQYFVNAYHDLHCIKIIYVSLRSYQLAQPQVWPAHHVFHCLDQLRVDVICAADDTLRSAQDTLRAAGASQSRRCRDFDKLEAWMNKNVLCIPENQKSTLELRNHVPIEYCSGKEL